MTDILPLSSNAVGGDGAAGGGRLRVLYVMGVGRSGSTVLDTVLGSHASAVSVGELCNLPNLGWQQGHFCACGEAGNQCPFWAEVQRHWVADGHGLSVEDYIRLQNKFSNFRRLGGLRWLALARNRRRPGRDFQSYLAATRAMFQSIAAAANVPVVVDSSKNPLRGAVLSLVPELDLHVIHLVRDGRAVAWSRKKAYKKDEKAGIQRDFRPVPAWYSAAYWAAVNAIARRVRRRLGPRCITVRYEDFVSDPAATLSTIGQFTGLDMTAVIRAIQDETPLPVGHTIAGNRLRMAGSVKLRADVEWMQKLPPRDCELCWTVAGWMLKKYDYPKRAA